jgi:UDP-N-acetylglucosamine diphosphorylase/glucosamine-1-phosphate N-acetyltransferase
MITLFDTFIDYKNLLPLTFTKPISLLRVGMFTFKERAELMFKDDISFLTEDHLADEYALRKSNLYVNSTILLTDRLVRTINSLVQNQVLVSKNKIVALNTSENITREMLSDISFLKKMDNLHIEDVDFYSFHWDLFSKNDVAIKLDFDFYTKNKQGEQLNSTNTILGNNIFVEKGAKVNCAILNTETGPIYIGKDAEIMEGATIRGPFVLNENAGVKMGAKIYGATTIGPHCKVGGEISNSILIGYSNKGHDGFLGNSVIGEWCNLGADTNNSNLKNNYSNIRAWNYHQATFIETGLQFLGLIMGDFSKTGINTMLNTGTVIGVASNVFGGGFPVKFIPSFSWGGAEGFVENKLEKVFEAADKMMERRNCNLTKNKRDILTCANVYSNQFRTL